MASALNSITGGASTIRGYGGLASGLDTDSLIKGMTAATRAKIAKTAAEKTDLCMDTGCVSVHQLQTCRVFQKVYFLYEPEHELIQSQFLGKK